MNSAGYVVSLILLSVLGLVVGGQFYTFGFKRSGEQIGAPIPIHILFSPEENLSAYTEPFLVSPDGKMLAYRAPGQVPGTRTTSNIWVKMLATGELRQLTRIGSESNSGNLGRYFWQSDSKKIWYLQDSGGDDKYQLYAVLLAVGPRGDLQQYPAGTKITQHTHPPGYIRTVSFLSSVLHQPSHPHDLVFVHNGKVSRLNMLTGAMEKISGIPGAPITDSTGDIRASVATTAAGKQLFLKGEGGSWVPHITWGPEEFEASYVLGFDATGSLIYLIDSVGSDTARLITYNPLTRERLVLASDGDYDISLKVPYSIVYGSDGCTISAVSVYKDKRTWIFCDAGTEQLFNQFKELGSCEMRVISQDQIGRKAVIVFDEPTRASRYHLVDRFNGSSQLISELVQRSKPAADRYQLGIMKPISFESRDGHTVHGYLTMPVGHSRHNAAPTSQDIHSSDSTTPLVVLVHGGPRQRDLWGYRPDVQFFATRGFAVLQINFRGSSGYGKTWRSMGFRQWGGRMVDDVIDGTRWAVENGIADPQRIIAMGGSYGGFAALTAAIKEPELYAAVIDLFGITNLLDFFGRVRQDAPEFYKLLIHTVGDVESDQALLRAQSPYFNVDKLRCPVFVAHGAKDSRVPLEESEKFVAQLKKYGVEHEFHLFDDEGHGFRKWQNNCKLFELIEVFLRKHSLFKT